ncbi:putative 2-aminoethylphosphonate ABC transporter ATP-binding protein [Xanthobacter tagetidis]|uniref:Putative 2-aminoethylphosphonate ABC transporter ATP-binding protein n=1 Tax=Xanthobacter tagetidis TaxID=60216 RepID=A0A3L7ANK4_9HYPH|nr:putative 2-aminoethylphosphonate ABC transporter ATP-binding protein [Xanthobacter tagetidis]MBB6307671.1 iron(III) transport system ATP-binding protein [Xanthobacter tagetidis]RLP81230.1 putative 2-aminoethylphosphonate ABC transporter ATP-binding protein [Xanthobacter tagetidis]
MSQHTVDLSGLASHLPGSAAGDPGDAIARGLAASAPRPTYLAVADVSKRFGDFTALKNVSLDVREGEFVCFLGPSGCGKTTLLRAIAGLDIQNSGTIRQAGRDISALPPEERDFGIVFQSYALFPNMTVRQNIAFGLENRGLRRPAVAARVDELLHLIDLSAHGHKYPSQISGGQQQRVALARALAPSPGLILLDEPLSALDAKVRLHLRAELKQLQARLGVTTVMVTHDQDEALSIADRIVVMNMGVVEQVGTPQEIYDAPASQFVADFIGAMNFVEGVMLNPDEVMVGDLTLVLRRQARPAAAGERVVVAIRPEDVRVLGADAHAEWEHVNRVAVEVAAVEFLGSHVRASLRHPAFPAKPLVAQLSQSVARALQIVPGRRLDVVLPTDRLRVYEALRPHGAAAGAVHG